MSTDPARHLHLASDHPDPHDPGGAALEDVNAEPDDDGLDDDPAFVATLADAARWDECVSLAEKMADQQTDLVPAISRALYFSDIPTDNTDMGRGGQPIEPTPGAEDVPDGIPD